MNRFFVPAETNVTIPRNELGQSATKTPAETVARLQEKARGNRGRANRERIRARIASASLMFALLLGSCGGAAAAPTSSPTVASATAAAMPSSPLFATSECTSANASTRDVVERYFALSTSNNVQAVSDCFAKAWRDKNATFADAEAVWSNSGPATSVTVTLMDSVNGCDRFGVGAQLAGPPNSAYRVPKFFSVGPENGRMRIYETSTALTGAAATALSCP